MTSTKTHTGTTRLRKEKALMAQEEVSVKTYVEKISKLIENDANPRKIQRKSYEALKKSLQEFPEMKQLREIVVDENLTILGGHQRIFALRDLGYTDVTVKQVTGLTAKQKREFIIKDNTSSGDWDSDILANQWEATELEDWGFKDFNFGDINPEPKEPAANDDQSKQHTCPNCGLEFED